MTHASSLLLSPAFEKAYWRSLRRRKFREYSGFSKKKGHFEPEDQNQFATRWAGELTRIESAEEISRIYESCVSILGNKRSQMRRDECDLDCKQFRFSIESSQDPQESAYVLMNRSLWIKAPLNQLPKDFDLLFPEAPDEVVVPVEGGASRLGILETLEHWETVLKGRISESIDQNVYTLHLDGGFVITVNLLAGEVSFCKRFVSGPLYLAAVVSDTLKGLGIVKQIGLSS